MNILMRYIKIILSGVLTFILLICITGCIAYWFDNNIIYDDSSSEIKMYELFWDNYYDYFGPSVYEMDTYSYNLVDKTYSEDYNSAILDSQVGYYLFVDRLASYSSKYNVSESNNFDAARKILVLMKDNIYKKYAETIDPFSQYLIIDLSVENGDIGSYNQKAESLYNAICSKNSSMITKELSDDYTIAVYPASNSDILNYDQYFNDSDEISDLFIYEAESSDSALNSFYRVIVKYDNYLEPFTDYLVSDTGYFNPYNYNQLSLKEKIVDYHLQKRFKKRIKKIFSGFSINTNGFTDYAHFATDHYVSIKKARAGEYQVTSVDKIVKVDLIYSYTDRLLSHKYKPSKRKSIRECIKTLSERLFIIRGYY